MTAQRMTLDEALETPPAPATARRAPVKVPKAGEAPGTFEWNGETGVIATRPLSERPRTWDAFIRDAGLDPDDVEVVEPVKVKGWDALGTAVHGANPVHRLRWYQLALRKRRPGPSIDELVKIAGRRRPRTRSAPTGTGTFLVEIGDLQLGKVDGDGVEGTLERAQDRIEAAADRLRRLRRIESIGPVHVAWMGDACEGFVSQGGANIWRTVLSITEQVRILRRLMLFSVDVFRPLTDELSVVCVPGNHDQALRPNGSGATWYADSFDVEAMVAVWDAIRHNPAYGHVTVHVPERDELTVTVETSGTIVTHAHGHMWRPGKHFDWWKGQAFGRSPAREADVLLAGHLHHFNAQDDGPRRFIQCPALESESTWYRHSTGAPGAPGIVTGVLRDGAVRELDCA